MLTIAARTRSSGIDALVHTSHTENEEVCREYLSSTGPGPGGVGQRIEEAMELIEMELRHTIAYVNDAVVPQVRKESITAMRKMADTLRNLADRIEQQKGPRT